MIWLDDWYKNQPWNWLGRSCLFQFIPLHYDVIKWNHFPRYWPCVWGIHWSSVNSPHKGLVTRSFDVFFNLLLNKRVSKQSWGRWVETPPRSLWRHCDVNLKSSPQPTHMQQKLQISCSRCNKNTWHVESSYRLQTPKYLLLFVNRFRYINNNVTKDRCSIPMDTTVRPGPLKFSLRATIDHHGPPIHSGHYTASINCCKKHSIATITQLWSLELLIAKLLYCIFCTIWIDWHLIFGLEQEGVSLIAPMALAHPLHPIDNRSRERRRNLTPCAFQTGCQLSSAATGTSLELRFLARFQWREAYVLDNWQLAELPQSGGREFDPRLVHDNLSVPLWVYMRFPVPEHQN